MKKRYATALSEILYSDINTSGDHTEDALKVFLQYFLDAASGVVVGLGVTSPTSGTISVATGIILDSTYAFGELESPSGISVTIPGSGTHTDTVYAQYAEVTDSASGGWTILDTDTRLEQFVSLFRRKFGSITIGIEYDTVPSGLAASKIPLATLTRTTAGVTAVDTNVKLLAECSSLNKSIDVEKMKEFSYLRRSINGLNITIQGGTFRRGTTIAAISDTTLTLTDNATNQVYISSGAVIVSSVGDSSTIPDDTLTLYEIVTSGGVITTIYPRRALFSIDAISENTPTDDQKDALVGTSGTPSSSNKYVTSDDPRIPSQGENDALVGTSGTPSSSNKYVTNADSRLVPSGGTPTYVPSGGSGGSKIQSGTGSNGSATFATAFSGTPNVVCVVGPYGSAENYSVMVTSVSTSGFNFQTYDADSGSTVNVAVMYIAIGT